MNAGRIDQLVPFWDQLTQREQESVRQHAQVRRYAAGSIIHSREQECLGLIRVLSGHARTFMLSEEGREITLYQLEKDDLDVLSASCVVSQITFQTQLVADADCEILVIPAVCMADLKEHNLYVRCFIFEKLGERFSDVMGVMQDMLFTRMDHRIAQYLLREEAASGSKTLRTTHEAVAAKINSSREVVSRTLKEMERGGMIRLERGRITILDKRQLEMI